MRMTFKREVEAQYGMTMRETWEITTTELSNAEKPTADVSLTHACSSVGIKSVSVDDIPFEVREGLIEKLEEQREELGQSVEALVEAGCNE